MSETITNIPSYEDWMDELSSVEYIELQKKYGHYWHDIGMSEDDWKDVYKQEFKIKDPNSISIKDVINCKELLEEKDKEIKRLKSSYEDSLNMQKCSNAGFMSKISELNLEIDEKDKEIEKLKEEVKWLLSKIIK